MAKIGLYLCECGPNIAEVINLDTIAEEIKKDGKVAGIERHKLLCSDDGKKFLVESIQKNEFERIVIAACSPKQHEGTFMEVMENADLNPYMFQLVNIREQCAWTTPDKEAATLKALRTLRAAINRVKHHAPLETKEIECNADVIVIGSSITSLETALRTAQRNRKVYLITEDMLNSSIKNYGMLLPSMKSTEEFFKTKIEELKKNKQIEVFEKSKINEILGFFGNFVATIQTKENKDVQLNAGSVVLAIDAQLYEPKGLDTFGYEKFDDVYTAHQFVQMSGDKIKAKSGTPPKSIAIIHCVGRKKLGYCSKACCVNSMRIARYIKKQLDGAHVTQFYKNLCLPDTRYDNYYKETKEKGIEFIRYKDINVAQENGKLVITYKNENGKEDTKSVEMIILSTGLVPDPRIKRYSDMFNIPIDEYGFLKEEHTKLGPVSTITEGVFVAGGMHGPGGIDDAITQAAAAAGKILSLLVPGRRLQLETKISNVSEAMCVGCGVCVTICTYGAVKIDESRHISVVNEVLCRGCGNCAAACPSGAARHRHFTTKQIAQEMMEILK